MTTRGPLRTGEPVLLIDRKQRRYLFDLLAGAEFHSHAGVIRHDDLIGTEEGGSHRSSRGVYFTVIRPTLSDFVLKMPRGAQVIYPKDLGAILMQADIFPGARVFESGLGSGALSAVLLRAGAEIVGYEVREDFEARARENVGRLLGDEALARYRTEIRDSYHGIAVHDLDRVVLDLPEPWRVVPHAATVLRRGGILVAYTPSIIQATQIHECMEDSPFGLVKSMEVMHRGWHIAGAAVRPDHRMVGHTGFLTSARLLGS